MNEPLRIGYVLKMFPRLSETFILDELLEHERAGAGVSIFSLMYPADGRFHGRVGRLAASVEYFKSGKIEPNWDAVQALPEAVATPLERWRPAIDFLRRHEVPHDLDVVLRATRIAARVRELGVEHLHAHFATGAARMAAVVGKLTGVPFSFTAHAKDIFTARVDRRLFTELASAAAFVVTVSDYNRSFILEHMPDVQADKVVRLYNGVDLETLRPAARPGSRAERHIVSVGRLVPKKGFDHLLRALARCKACGLPFRATVAGDGPERDALERLRGELGLTEEVTFPGALAHEAVQRVLADADLVALACVPEDDGDADALPTVLLEALAMDVPVVSTRLTGVPEIVGDEAGLLVEPGDDDAFARAILSIAGSAGATRPAPGVARARAERLFDLRTNSDTLRDLFSRSARPHVGA